MKQRIVHLSPHQDAKVMANLMAINCLISGVPLVSVATLNGAPPAEQGLTVLLIMPLVYLVIGYILSVIGCADYNFQLRFIGGFEFESNRDGGLAST